MSTLVVPPGAVGRRPGAEARRLLRQRAVWIGRWLLASPQQALEFRPRATAASVTATRVDADLPDVLDSWRRALAHRRTVVLLRRYLLLGALLACLCALACRLSIGSIPWEAVVIPVGLLLGAAVLVTRRPLTQETTARLLDRALLLHEQVATALELRGTRARAMHGLLAARLEQQAQTALVEARRDWSVHDVSARREWLGIALSAAALALVLLLPHGSVIGSAVGPRRVPAVPSAPAPVRSALVAPPLRSHGRLIQLQATVVSSPVPRTAPAATAHAHKPGLSRHLLTAHQHSVARSHAGRPAAAPTAGAHGASPKTSGTPLPGGAPSGGPQPAHSPPGAAGPPLSVFKGNPRQVLPSSKAGSSSAAKRSASTGNAFSRAQGAAAGSAAGGKQGRQRAAGAAAPAGQHAAAPQSGGLPPGVQALPYGGGLHLTPSQLPKPGLIEGSGVFQGKGTPGGSGVGHEPGSTPVQPGVRPSLPSTKGRQFTLQSGYGSRAGTRTGRPAPGQSPAAGGHGTASDASGQAGLQVIDYVSADSNVVASPDRAIVTSYFDRRTAHQ
jgi:hypothetical protein